MTDRSICLWDARLPITFFAGLGTPSLRMSPPAPRSAARASISARPSFWTPITMRTREEAEPWPARPFDCIGEVQSFQQAEPIRPGRAWRRNCITVRRCRVAPLASRLRTQLYHGLAFMVQRHGPLHRHPADPGAVAFRRNEPLSLSFDGSLPGYREAPAIASQVQ
jgi:hypothetical protein